MNAPKDLCVHRGLLSRPGAGNHSGQHILLQRDIFSRRRSHLAGIHNLYVSLFDVAKTKVLSYETCAVIAALELTSRNILCGSVRMVYAIIYTLFLVSLLSGCLLLAICYILN